MEEIRARTAAHVADARERGATVAAGAEPHPDGGLFSAPRSSWTPRTTRGS